MSECSGESTDSFCACCEDDGSIDLPYHFQSQKGIDERYRVNGIEYYGNYQDLKPHLEKYTRKKDKLVLLGKDAGDLAPDFYDDGYTCLNVLTCSWDWLSENKPSIQVERSSIQFSLCKLKTLPLESESQTCVISMHINEIQVAHKTAWDVAREVRDLFLPQFKEVARILRCGGRFIVFSELDRHFQTTLLTYFHDESFIIRVCKLPMEFPEDNLSPHFMVVMTKLAVTQPGILSLLESSMDNHIRRHNCLTSLMDEITTEKSFCTAGYLLNSRTPIQKEVSVNIHGQADRNFPRYIIHVVTIVEERVPNCFCVLVAPCGREGEWLFNTPQGRLVVAKNILECHRVVIVQLGILEKFSSLDEIEEELRPKMLYLKPPYLKQNAVVPFNFGSPLEGCRTLKIHESVLGLYVIQESLINDETAKRRLICIDNGNRIMSEVQLLTESMADADGILPVDPYRAGCDYHIVMAACLKLLPIAGKKVAKDSIKILILGIGAGTLATFLLQHFHNVEIHGCDIDENLLIIGEKYFGFPQSKRFTYVHDDAFNDVENRCNNGETFDMVMMDIDTFEQYGDDPHMPPVRFLKSQFLMKIKKIIPEGMFVVAHTYNCAIQREVLKRALGSIGTVFDTFGRYKLLDSSHEVVFCWSKADPNCLKPKYMRKVLTEFNKETQVIEDEVTINTEHFMKTVIMYGNPIM